MKMRYLPALVAVCALLSAFAAGPALAGGGLPLPAPLGQSVTNTTDQSNDAAAINVPILSGNNVAVLSNGDQSSSAGTDQEQTNVNATSQDASQSGSAGPAPTETTSNTTDQSNDAAAINVPIVSGNNVAVLSNGDQSSSAGTDQEQTNVNATDQQASQGGQSGSGDPDNSTEQSNHAKAVNVPIVSGNNVSVLSNGKQSSSAGVEQTQTNVNVTDQQASQSGSGSDGWYGKKSGGSIQKVENSTEQSNHAKAVNVPIVSGNNVSVLSNGKQSSSAGVEQTQTNVNVTKQAASQSGGSSWTDTKRCKQKDGRFESTKQSVRNWTDQENRAKAFNLPILSGNNVSVLSNGKQWSSAGVEQTQTNVNVTKQAASQSGGSSWTDTKRCKQKDGRFESSKQSVRNWTDQENRAKAFNLPILSGNNVSVLSNGKQWSSARIEQTQTNVNYTVQQARLRP